MRVRTPRLTIELDVIALTVVVALMVVAITYRRTVEVALQRQRDERPSE